MPASNNNSNLVRGASCCSCAQRAVHVIILILDCAKFKGFQGTLMHAFLLQRMHSKACAHNIYGVNPRQACLYCCQECFWRGLHRWTIVICRNRHMPSLASP